MIFDDSFNTDPTTQLAEWEKLLRAELKLEDVGSKTSKKTPEGTRWPTLWLETQSLTQLPVQNSWKKAAQTYIQYAKNLAQLIDDDLNSGVRSFFLEKEYLTSDSLNLFLKTVETHPKHAECEIFLLGSKQLQFKSSTLKVIDENNFHHGRLSHELGGDNIQELALLALFFVRKIENQNGPEMISVFVDSHFFRNIAKIRAAKLLALKISQTTKSSKTFPVVALSSFREWTLYERYSNLLRNDAAVASAYIAGADHVQSSGYQALFEIELESQDLVHDERSRRMARNTSHILALESMLGVVEDAAFGSYHIENLTQHYAQEAWTLMQQLLPLNETEAQKLMIDKASKVRGVRTEEVRTRKHILAGMNDFPDVKDCLKLQSKPTPRFYRVAQDFENLRLEIESLKTKPRVSIVLYGEYSALVPRVNFVKNYFELLGLEVLELGKSQSDLETFKKELSQNKNEIIVLCSSDDNYEILKESLPPTSADKFIAGKFSLTGYQNLFAGQNVYEVLEALVKKWGSK